MSKGRPSRNSEHNEVLLFTGLGDDSTIRKQERYIDWLNKRRPETAQIHMFATRWHTPETYEEKRKRALAFVAEHQNARVGYGISAGAGLLLSLATELPEDFSYHFISGKLRRPETIGKERNKSAPALYDTVVASEQSFEAKRSEKSSMNCYAGFLDGVLRIEDMRLPDVAFKRIPMIHHTATITLAYVTVLPHL